METGRIEKMLALASRLEAILADELAGTPIDHEEAARVIADLAVLCPTISETLSRIADRMNSQKLANVA